MNELRNIFDDIKNRKYIESYIVSVAGIVILVIDIIGDVDQSIMNEVILAILATLVYIVILERREFSKLSDRGDIKGIVAFGPNRDGLSPLGERLEGAKSEIAVLAVQHTILTHQYLGLLKKKAEAGCRIKILMMAPRDRDGNVNPNVKEAERHRTYTDLLSRLESSTNTFSKWLSQLDSHVRERVKIRSYLEYPTATYLFVDKDEPDGYVQVEPLLYGIDVNNLPHYVVIKKDSKDFFKTHTESFQKLWKESKKRKLLPNSNE